MDIRALVATLGRPISDEELARLTAMDSAVKKTTGTVAKVASGLGTGLLDWIKTPGRVLASETPVTTGEMTDWAAPTAAGMIGMAKLPTGSVGMGMAKLKNPFQKDHVPDFNEFEKNWKKPLYSHENVPSTHVDQMYLDYTKKHFPDNYVTELASVHKDLAWTGPHGWAGSYAPDGLEIAAALEKNPGASIFDVAGIPPPDVPKPRANITEATTQLQNHIDYIKKYGLSEDLAAGFKTKFNLTDQELNQALTAAGAPHGPSAYSQSIVEAAKERTAKLNPAEQIAPIDWAKMSGRKGDVDWFPVMPEEVPVDFVKALGFNLDVPLYKGGSRDYYRNLPDPSRKNYERASFFADKQDVAAKYGTPLQHVARAEKAGEVDWLKATGKSGYDEADMHMLIEAAREKGHDLLHIKNLYDMGGMQNQIAVLNPAIVRAPSAKFDPDKLHISDILAGLGSGAVLAGVGAQEAKAAPPKAKLGVPAPYDNPVDKINRMLERAEGRQDNPGANPHGPAEWGYGSFNDPRPKPTPASGKRVDAFTPQGKTNPNDWVGGYTRPGYLPTGEKAVVRSESTQFEKARRDLPRPHSIIESILSPESSAVVDAIRRRLFGRMRETGYITEKDLLRGLR